MRVSKLITLSAAAVLAGGANIALAATSMQGSSSLHGQNIASQRSGAYARANPRELGEAGLTSPGRTRMREIKRTIPRVSNIGSTDIRIDGVVSKGVRQAAAPLPPDVLRKHPHLSMDRAFRYRDQVVILNPVTSRIVALIKMPG